MSNRMRLMALAELIDGNCRKATGLQSVQQV
jgi:hypothetical protein